MGGPNYGEVPHSRQSVRTKIHSH